MAGGSPPAKARRRMEGSGSQSSQSQAGMPVPSFAEGRLPKHQPGEAHSNSTETPKVAATSSGRPPHSVSTGSTSAAEQQGHPSISHVSMKMQQIRNRLTDVSLQAGLAEMRARVSQKQSALASRRQAKVHHLIREQQMVQKEKEAAIRQAAFASLSLTASHERAIAKLAELQASESAAKSHLRSLHEEVSAQRASHKRSRLHAVQAAEESTAAEQSELARQLRRRQAEVEEQLYVAERRLQQEHVTTAASDRQRREVQQLSARVEGALTAGRHAKSQLDSAKATLAEVQRQLRLSRREADESKERQIRENEAKSLQSAQAVESAKQRLEQSTHIAQRQCEDVLQWLEEMLQTAKVQKREEVAAAAQAAEAEESRVLQCCQRWHATVQAAEEARRSLLPQLQTAELASKTMVEALRGDVADTLAEEQHRAEQTIQASVDTYKTKVVDASALELEADRVERLAVAAEARLHQLEEEAAKEFEKVSDLQMKSSSTAEMLEDEKQRTKAQAESKRNAVEKKVDARIAQVTEHVEGREAAATAAEAEASAMEQAARESEIRSDKAIQLAERTRDEQVEAAEELARTAVQAVKDNMRLAGAGKRSLLSCLLSSNTNTAELTVTGVDEAASVDGDGVQNIVPQTPVRAAPTTPKRRPPGGFSGTPPLAGVQGATSSTRVESTKGGILRYSHSSGSMGSGFAALREPLKQCLYRQSRSSCCLPRRLDYGGQ